MKLAFHRVVVFLTTLAVLIIPLAGESVEEKEAKKREWMLGLAPLCAKGYVVIIDVPTSDILPDLYSVKINSSGLDYSKEKELEKLLQTPFQAADFSVRV